MKTIIKSITIISLTLIMSCSNNMEPQPNEESSIDSALEESGEKVKDVNEGIKKGYEESKEEIKEKTKELLADSIPH